MHLYSYKNNHNTHCFFTVLCTISLLMSHCVGPKVSSGYVDNTPEELQNLVSTKYAQSMYAIGTATDQNETIASNKAAMQARAEIARQFKVQIDVLQKGYEETIVDRSNQQYQQTIEAFASLQLHGSKIAKTLIKQEKNGMYSAKALVIVSAGQLKTIVDEKLHYDIQLKASQAYKELEERVQKEQSQQNND